MIFYRNDDNDILGTPKKSPTPRNRIYTGLVWGWDLAAWPLFRPHENMVGVNMVLAEHHQNTLK